MSTKNSKKKKCCHADKDASMHPDHSYILTRLNRAQGQLNGIEKMVHDRRYCVDILIQFRAVMAALRSLEVEVFKTHLEHCVSQAMKAKSASESEEKIKELTELLVRRTQL